MRKLHVTNGLFSDFSKVLVVMINPQYVRKADKNKILTPVIAEA